MEPKPAGPPPTHASLHEAALLHLSRFAATEAGLVRVLDRRVARWKRLAEAAGTETEAGAVDARAMEARAAVRAVARGLVAAGVVDDAAFATARAARLQRAGRSRRAASAHLMAKGVAPDTVAAALPSEAEELDAALVFARRRRLGPFRTGGEAVDAAVRQRELAMLGRGGFPREVAERALRMPPDDAAARVLAVKRG